MSDAVSVPSDALPQDDRGLSAPPPSSSARTSAVGLRAASGSSAGARQVSPRRLWALVAGLLAVLFALLIASVAHALDAREASVGADVRPGLSAELILTD